MLPAFFAFFIEKESTTEDTFYFWWMLCFLFPKWIIIQGHYTLGTFINPILVIYFLYRELSKHNWKETIQNMRHLKFIYPHP